MKTTLAIVVTAIVAIIWKPGLSSSHDFTYRILSCIAKLRKSKNVNKDVLLFKSFIFFFNTILFIVNRPAMHAKTLDNTWEYSTLNICNLAQIPFSLL